MRHLAVLTAVHGRHVLAQNMVAHARSTAPEGWAISVLAVVSPEDASSVGPVFDSLGVAWTVKDNKPVSFKWQSGLAAVESVFPKAEAVMILGSDDFASPKYVEAVCARLEAGEVEPFGQWRVWMLCAETGEVGFFQMVDRTKTLGAGRVFPRKALDAMDWTLWTEGINVGLDNHSGINCKTKGHEIRPVELPGIVVDVKDAAAGNIHCWEKFMTWGKCPVTRFSQIMGQEAGAKFLASHGMEALLAHVKRV